MRDYNSLPVGRYRQLKVAGIDGTDSCIMEHGFEHLRGLEDLWRMALVNNKYLTDDSIEILSKYTKVGSGNINGTQSYGHMAS